MRMNEVEAGRWLYCIILESEWGLKIIEERAQEEERGIFNGCRSGLVLLLSSRPGHASM